LLLAAAGLAGCDVVQGFEHAGDALFPPIETYLDVPGYRMTAGHFRYLDMVTTSEPYVLARSTVDGDDTLYAMHFHSPVPCPIPNAARYWTDGGPNTRQTFIAFFDATDPDTLHFSDLDCAPLDFTLATPNLPIAYSPTGLVIQVGQELLDVNPAKQTMTVLASELQGYDTQRHIVVSGGRIDVFDADWSFQRSVGDGVVTAPAAFGATYYADSSGVSRLSISTTGGAVAVETLELASDACDLAVLPATPNVNLVAFHSPCSEQQPFVWNTDTHEGTPLGLDVDLRYLKIYSGLHAQARPNLATDPYYALYLTDIDADSNTGTLNLKLTDGSVLTLGTGAALERSDLGSSSAGGELDRGHALLDAASGSGRYVAFDFAGNVSDIATGVLRHPAENAWTRLVVAGDGDLQNLVEVVDGAAVTVARNVPQRRYAYLNRFKGNPLAGKMAWFSDLDGDFGTLSLAAPDTSSGVLDDQAHEPLYAPDPVASHVYVGDHNFMLDLPGFVYYTSFDAKTGTGRLTYSNTELGFAATVSEGVSDYLQPGSGLLYTVPYGEGAGIWLARGK
jgi:hypothetical protein